MPMVKEPSFQSSIELRAQQSPRDHLHPGSDLINLARYFSSYTGHKSVAERPGNDHDEQDATTDFAVIQDFSEGSKVRFESSLEGLSQLSSIKAVPDKSILFIRGFAPPECLNIVGERYNVNPELYRRHLCTEPYTFGGRDLHTSPPLLSSSTQVFQLTIPTICVRAMVKRSYEPEDMREMRRSGAEAMETYFKHLRAQASLGDSIVRNCLFLSKQEYVIEQTISIAIAPPGCSWQAIVWLDCGQDLSQSPEGPWNPAEDKDASNTYFIPIVVQPTFDLPTQMAHERAVSRVSTQSATTQSVMSQQQDWRAAQNMCLLPSQYGANLDRIVASQDALYALSEVLRFAAAAEVQFLNLLSKRIGHELSVVGKADIGKFHAISLLNLRYIKASLTKHAQGFAEVINILQNRQASDAPNALRSATSERTALLLLADFEDLEKRAGDLSRECDQGMATLANVTVLEEARRSAGVATRVQRLTLMATIFIPLAFVSSVWGMNFKEMGSGTMPMWWWAVSAAPVLVLALLIYKFVPAEYE